MADFILQTIGGSITGTSTNDNMTFGIQVVDGIAFIATGSLAGSGGDDSFFTLDARALLNGVQVAYGNPGNDTITLSNLFTAYGGQDNDLIRAIPIPGSPQDFAAQQIFGNQGNDTIISSGGNDYIEGNQGFDLIDSGSENDFVWGGQENDTINGGAGADTIYGNQGGDLIDGSGGGGLEFGVGADSLQGGMGNDTIFGSLGAADFVAGNTDDTIIGAEGQDRLSGGAGLNIGTTPITSNFQYDDLFRYQYGPGACVGIANIDWITDFQSAGAAVANQRTDKLSFGVGADAVFAGLNFTTGTTYDVNRTVGGPADPVDGPVFLGFAINSYEALFTAIQTAFGAAQPVASTDAQLQVYNYTASGTITGGVVTNFLYLNNGDTTVSSLSDMVIQGVNVVDGTTGPTITDIIFG